ncbi:MAG: NAD(P)/FAD-dependent oxidoreductase [Gammaproteobacteria bacterium]|nr:NAD(P)/FAD-dependent oxidoreductase [Gammaproteobacteria bacterium]
MKSFDVIVIGAGAAGLFSAITAGQRGKKVLVLEHAKKVGRKILMSGGGRCNFTNTYTEPSNFLSANPHFCKSALSQYTQWDFIDLVSRHSIPYHEKTLGQLFCDNSSKDIVALLLKECEKYAVAIQCRESILELEQLANCFSIKTSVSQYQSGAVIVATGGLSIPSMGPHGFGYKIAKQFNLSQEPCSAALVPFVMDADWKKLYTDLSGNSLPIIAETDEASFDEAMLFTHKGLSGPAILQISSYWKKNSNVSINLLPKHRVTEELLELKQKKPDVFLKSWLAEHFTKRLVNIMCEHWFRNRRLNEFSDRDIEVIGDHLNRFQIKPETTEGYKTAEVTLGGVSTNELSSKTMMANSVPGLYFVGEVVDVTGHLGGYNFQWAWSSGWVAGQNV